MSGKTLRAVVKRRGPGHFTAKVYDGRKKIWEGHITFPIFEVQLGLDSASAAGEQAILVALAERRHGTH